MLTTSRRPTSQILLGHWYSVMRRISSTSTIHWLHIILYNNVKYFKQPNMNRFFLSRHYSLSLILWDINTSNLSKDVITVFNSIDNVLVPCDQQRIFFLCQICKINGGLFKLINQLEIFWFLNNWCSCSSAVNLWIQVIPNSHDDRSYHWHICALGDSNFQILEPEYF